MSIQPKLKLFQILYYLLVTTVVVYGSKEKEQRELFSDLLKNVRRDIIQHFDENLGIVSRGKRQHTDETSSLWYSYSFGTGTGNREVLKVSGIHEENWEGQGCYGNDVWLWKSLEISRNRGLLLGLGLSSLTLCAYKGSYYGSNPKEGQPGYYGLEYTLEISGVPTAAEIFQIWNETSKMMDAIVAVAIDFDKNSILVWYRVVMTDVEPILLQLPYKWDLHKSVWNLQSFIVNLDRKLLVLNHPEDGRRDSSVDVYGFIWEGRKMDFWLVQKLFVHAASSVAVINVGEAVFLGISQPDEGVINIYYFDKNDNKFKRFQEIMAPGVSNLVSFYVGFSSFVAVAGTKPMLLRYDKEEFVTEYIDGIDKLGLVSHWLPIPIRTYRNEVVLIAESKEGNDRVFSVVTWIGGHPGFSVKEPPTCYVDGLVKKGFSCISNPVVANDLNFGLESAAAISFGGLNPCIIIARTNGRSALFSFEAHLVSVQSPVEKEIALLRKRQQQLNALIEKQLDTIKTARKYLDERLDRNNANVITGSWSVKSLESLKLIVTEDDFHIFGNENLESWKFGNHNWEMGEVSSLGEAEMNSLSSKVDGLALSMREINYKIEDAVSLTMDEPVVISAPHTFEGTIYVSGSLSVENFQLHSLGEVEVDEIFSNTVRLDRAKTISGHKVMKTLSLENLRLSNKLGSIDASSLIFADEEHVMVKEVTYKNKLTVYGDVLIPEGGLINGLDLSEDILTVDGKFGGDFSIEFLDGISADEILTSNLNNLSINDNFFNSVMRYDDLDDVQFIKSSLLMSFLEVDGKRLTIKNINGQEFEDIISKLIFSNKGGNIPGKMYANDCHARSETYISSLNMLSFPDDFLMNKGKQLITGRKTFKSYSKEGSMRTDYLEISGLVNGLNTSDLITLSTDQNLKNTSFYFLDVEIKNLEVFENIDESVEKYKKPPLLGEENELFSDLHFIDVEIKGDIIVKGSLNDEDWEKVTEDIIYDDDNDFTVEAPQLFIKDLVTQSLNLKGLMNTLDISGYLTKDSEQTFVGRKIIGRNTFVKNLYVPDSLLGEINLKFLAENAFRISYGPEENLKLDRKSTAPYLDCHMIFKDSVFISSFFNTSTINELDHNEAAFLTKDQTFMGGAEFDTLEADTIFIDGSVITKKSLTGFNLREFNKTRFSLTEPQVINENADVYIHHALIDGDLKTDYINENNINELDISSLIASEVQPNIKYHIERMTVNGAVTTNGIGGYNLQDIQENAIWKDKENYILGDIVFHDEIYVSSLNVSDSINGYNLNSFLEDVLLKDEAFVTSGLTIFEGGLKVGNLTTSSLNGIPMENILTTYTFQDINETFRIKGDVLIDGKVTLESGKINEFQLSSFTDRYEWKNGVHILKGDTIVETPKIQELNVLGLVNNNEWRTFLESCTFINGHALFNGNISFENKVFVNGDFFVTKTIDGVDLEGIFGPRGSAVLLNNKGNTPNRLSHGVVDGLIRFKDDVVISNVLHVYENMTAERIYGCDLMEWAREVIYLDQSNYIKGMKTFNQMETKSEIDIAILNDINLSKIIFLSENQEILKQLNFKYLVSANDVDITVGISVNGLNLEDEYKNTLLKEGVQLISGKKKFGSMINFKGDILTNGTVNDISMKEVVTLNTDQNITGLIEATTFVVKQDLRTSGFINEKDFSQWAELGVGKDCSERIISGTWIVKGNVTFVDEIFGEGMLNGVNISEYHELSSIGSRNHQLLLKQAKERLVTSCEQLNYIEKRARNQPVLFSELEAVQKIHPKLDILSLFTFSVFNNTYLVLTYANTCGGELYIWDSMDGTFDLVYSLNFAGGSEWHYLGSISDYAMLLVGSKDWRDCEHNGYNIWRFDPQTLQFEFIQSLGDFKTSVMVENIQGENLLYTLEEEGIYKWTLSSDGNYLQKSLNETEFLKLSNERDCITPFMAKYNDSMNIEDIKKLIYGIDKYVILNISKNLTLGAHITSDNTVVKGPLDYIEVFNLENGKLFTKLPSFNPTSLITLDFGLNKQKMLVFIENYRSLKMYEYKGLEGFREILSFRAKFNHLSSVSLRYGSLFSPLNFILASNESHVVVFRAEVLGDPLDEEQSLQC